MRHAAPLCLFSLLVYTPLAQAKPKEYTSFRVDLDGKTALCPGETQDIDLFGTDAKGKETKVRFGNWDQFQMTWELGEVSKKGFLAMPYEPATTWGKAGTLTVALLSDPSLTTITTLPVRYDCSMSAGAYGPSGQPGQAGERGASVAAEPGGDGGDGGNGQDGGDGPTVQVLVRLAKEPLHGEEVLQVSVTDTSTGATSLHAVAVTGGQLVIGAVGGSGGPGGPGGAGGSGATGLDGGDGGDGGQGGDGGRGGKIVVKIDPSAQGKTDALVFDTRGGAPGPEGLAGDAGQGFSPGVYGNKGHPGHPGHAGPDGGPAQITKGSVPPLW